MAVVDHGDGQRKAAPGLLTSFSVVRVLWEYRAG